MQNYTAGDAAYTRLNLYDYMLEMLNMNIRGAAKNGIEKNIVERMEMNRVVENLIFVSLSP